MRAFFMCEMPCEAADVTRGQRNRWKRTRKADNCDAAGASQHCIYPLLGINPQLTGRFTQPVHRRAENAAPPALWSGF